jgi:hypothetical protein
MVGYILEGFVLHLIVTSANRPSSNINDIVFENTTILTINHDPEILEKVAVI